MRYGRIEVDSEALWVRVEGDHLVPLSGSPLDGPPDVVGASLALADACWLPPAVPPVFYAAGMNYREHIEHAIASGSPSAVMPQRPEIGYRANNALTAHNCPIIVPSDVTGRFEAEPEVVAVIGKQLRNASRSEAEEAIFGWTIGNDVSARTWQRSDRTFWRSKNADTFKPMGPWIETAVEPMAQTTTVMVNGQERASFKTGGMVFDPWDFLVEMSRYITIHPGDVLWMGADAMCQIDPGDTVDIEITGIGVLSNPVQQDEPTEGEAKL